jgi:hypothetical protein
MSFLSRLFGRRGTKEAIVARITNGPGKFAFSIVGESHYQRNIAQICGPKDEDSTRRS